MDYLKDLSSLGKILNDNKWNILFVVFGILIAYSVGKSMAVSQNKETFESRCEKEKTLYENNKPPCDMDDDADDDEGDEEKITVASASCPQMPDMKSYMRKEDCPDLSDYMHKSLIPDLNKYISRESVKENYISRETLKKNYMRKCDCRQLPPKEEPIQELDEPPCDIDPPKKIACDTVPTSKINPTDNKIQAYLDKNKENMDVTYSTLDDAFCNKKSCFINGLPDGLRPLK